jgi:hypothetical protein
MTVPNLNKNLTIGNYADSAIIRYEMDFTGYELDPDYFDQGCKRFEDFKSQLTLF